MITQYFITDVCKNKNKELYEDYYIYVNDTDQLFHMRNLEPVELCSEIKENILKSDQTLISKENCINNEFYKKLIDSESEEYLKIETNNKVTFEKKYSTNLKNDKYNLYFTSKQDRDNFIDFFNNTVVIEKSFENWLTAYPSLLDAYTPDKIERLIWKYLTSKFYNYKSFCSKLPHKEVAFAKCTLNYIKYFHKYINFFMKVVNNVKEEFEKDQKNMFSKTCAHLASVCEDISESCIYYDDRNSYIFYHLYGNSKYIYIKTNDCIWCYNTYTEVVTVFNSKPQIEKRFSELQLKKDIKKKIVDKIKNKLVEKFMEEKKMNEIYTKVKVVPKSEKYTREDIETALNEAYEENRYVLDFIKETGNYIILYLKEKDL